LFEKTARPIIQTAYGCAHVMENYDYIEHYNVMSLGIKASAYLINVAC
jgi:hypothetical protein